MEDIELDGTTKTLKTLMCPICNIPLFKKNEKYKFFLFCCRACNYQEQQDHEFSWETCKVNNQLILPNVKCQRKSTCDPHTIVTAIEGAFKFECAKEKKVFEESLSINDLVTQYENQMGTGFSWDSNEKQSRTKVLKEMMETVGVMSDKDFKSGKTGIRYKAKSRMQAPAFKASCKKILRGSLLHTAISISRNFDSLGGDEIYTFDQSKRVVDKERRVISHAIVLVGFGVKNKLQYFRFQNSHGTRFGKHGFGSVGAREISEVSSFEPLKQ